MDGGWELGRKRKKHGVACVRDTERDHTEVLVHMPQRGSICG